MRSQSAFPVDSPDDHNMAMERPSLQLSVTAMLLLVAAVAFNLWLFRLGPLLGIIGLNLTKHVAIAGLCQVLGVDRRRTPNRAREPSPPSSQIAHPTPNTRTNADPR